MIAIYSAIKVSYHKASIMGILHEEGEPQNKHFFGRFFITLLVFFAFFLFVFNMMMEWLAIAVDATLLLAALFVYLLLVVRHKITTKTFIHKVGDIGNDFYSKFLDHFRYKESFLLGISGLLVLHLITDIGIYLVPFLTGLRDPLYLSKLGTAGHEGVWNILSRDLTLSGDPFLLLIFIANIVGYLILFSSPAIVWYKIYHKKTVRLSKQWLIIFFSSIPSVTLAPLFLIKRLDSSGFIGVDVNTVSMLSGVNSIVVLAFTILFLIFSIVMVSGSRKHLQFMEQLWIGITVIFFGIYSYLYFIDVASFFQKLVIGLLQSSQYFLGIIFFIFQGLTIIFYISGFLLFIYELGKHHRRNGKRLY